MPPQPGIYIPGSNGDNHSGLKDFIAAGRKSRFLVDGKTDSVAQRVTEVLPVARITNDIARSFVNI